jgi:hypothetical protein
MGSTKVTADPIRERYYAPLEWVDRLNGVIFYIGAVLSIAVLLIDPKHQKALSQSAFIVFVIVVVLFFILGISARQYFAPRAEEKRRLDFLGSAFGVNLTHEMTTGYYNNKFTEASTRLAAQLLENTFFTKSLTLRVAHKERAKMLCYLVLWLIALLNRKTDLGVILAATQAVFSEQLLSKLIRIEWFRAKCERIYRDVYRLLQGPFDAKSFLPMVLDSLLLYETAKSSSGVVVQSKLFKRMNPSLSTEWDGVRSTLSI